MLALVALLLAPAPNAHALETVLERSKEVEFSVGQNGFHSRESLKGTTKTQGDFNQANYFTLQIGGEPVGGVNTIEGLSTETDVVEYKDGQDSAMHFRPGRQKPGRITISRDFGQPDWLTTLSGPDGQIVERKSVSVIFHNDDKTAGSIDAQGCRPVQVIRERGPNNGTVRVQLDCLDVTTHFPVPSSDIPVPPPIVE